MIKHKSFDVGGSLSFIGFRVIFAMRNVFLYRDERLELLRLRRVQCIHHLRKEIRVGAFEELHRLLEEHEDIQRAFSVEWSVEGLKLADMS